MLVFSDSLDAFVLTISSSNIADAKITYTNAGVYATSTKPGWLSKIFREITPF